MSILFIASIRFASVAKTPRAGLNDGVEHMVGQWIYEKMADSYWAREAQGRHPPPWGRVNWSAREWAGSKYAGLLFSVHS